MLRLFYNIKDKLYMIEHSYPGKFIVFEGLDGSGQTTQSQLLADYLLREGRDVLLTKEPTLDSVEGKKVLTVLIKKETMPSDELQKLFAADRRQHLDNLIIPNLKQGKMVISDRYVLSSLAYGSIDLKTEWLVKLNDEFILPDITFVINVPVEVCLDRIHHRGEEITIFEDKDKLQKVGQAYKALSDRFKNIYILNGEESVNNVFEQVKMTIAGYLG